MIFNSKVWSLYGCADRIRNFVGSVSLLFFYCWLAYPTLAFSQSSLDSLKNLLKTTLPDTTKVLLLNKIGTEYLYSATDTSFIYIQQALSISERINFPLGVALAQHRLANIHRLQGNYPEALKNGFEALKIYTDLQVRSNIAGVQNALGGIYFRLEDYDKALSYFQQSLNHYEALGDELGKANQFVSLGNVYKNINKGEKALDYYFKALAVNRKSGKKLAVSINLENIGSLYIAQKKYDEALPYLFESLEISTEIKDQQGIASISRHMADIYQHKDQTQKSLEYGEMSLGVASKNKLKIEGAAASLILSKNYSSLGYFQKALEYYQLHVAYKDSLYSAEKLKELSSLENKYEIQQKEQELEIQAQRMALLNRDKEINRIWRNILAASLLILILLGILVYKFQRLKNQKNKQLLLTQQSVTQKLQELDKSKSRFFANISHEFRTPLTLILGPVEEMESGHFSGDPKPVFSMVRRNAQRLSHLVNQLLDLSKIEAGKMQLQAAEHDLVPFLETIAASYHSLAEHKHIAFEVHTDFPQIKLYFDRDKLENVLHNLLSNAFKFTSEGGKVSLMAVTGKSQVEIKVEDNGSGIPAEQLPKIFDRFYQVDSSHTREGEGTGIGLALTKELVELHHGKISVSSIEGQDATFTLQLPLGKSHLSPDEIAQEVPRTDYPVNPVKPMASSNGEGDQIERPISSQETIHRPQVLVVEDHQDMRQFICNILGSDYEVDQASDGLEGWEKAIETLPDLILSDVMMPRIDGVELCQKLKDDERTSHIPVILLTAKVDKSSKLEGLQTGADDYLAKPFDAEELLLLIGNRIEQRKKLRERFSRSVTLQPKDIAITSADERFLAKAIAIVEEHMDDPAFNVKAFVQEMPLGHMQVHRKLDALTDQSPVQFIRFLRLKRAAAKIEQREDTISQIAYSVGFNNLSYFAHCFKQQFGCSPSEYARQVVE